MHYLVRKLQELNPEDQDKVMDEILESITYTSKSTASQVGIELLSDYTDKAIEHYKNFGKMQGLSTGYPKLDGLTKGLVGGEMIVIAGKTSYGKTTMAINIANRVAKAGTPVLFVTLEMTKTEIASRYMQINGGEGENYNSVASITAVQAQDELDWTSIDGLIENFVQQFGSGLIVIDHLHYFTRELSNIAEDLGRITKELKKNAIRHNVPVILISHVRKTGKGESAGIDDLRGTSYIAQDADIVLLVGRDKDDESTLFVSIEKNRNRGYNYKANEIELYLDQITIHNGPPMDLPKFVK